ncbi:MAG TPA: sulfotransferase [bacterium]|jgi:hypothetical protein
MGRPPDFIGLGAQRSGTSWIYACLYEHPQICAPTKEIHFFSREHNWRRGRPWYEQHFASCGPPTVAGEFSTSYLASPDAPERIRGMYPAAKLLVSLRHPVERLVSSYLNDLSAGVVSAATPLAEALQTRPDYVEQGHYAPQLERYLRRFPRSQMLVLIYDDAVRDPAGFIGQIYVFLGIDPTFRPSMLTSRVGEGHVPRSVRFERALTHGGWVMRRGLTRRLWWVAKRAGVGRALRRANTADRPRPALPPAERRRLVDAFADDVTRLEHLLDRDLTAWRQ